MANHDWIIEVLSDMQSYARENRLKRVAASTNILIELIRLDLIDDARDQGYPVPETPHVLNFPGRVGAKDDPAK